LDLLVEIATRREGVLGSRMTGGGFGGCTITLVETAAVAEFQRSVSKEYKLATGIDAEIYVSKAGPGVSEVSVSV
jgi:galactokinase